jgi:chemotaxis signal transduction protein
MMSVQDRLQHRFDQARKRMHRVEEIDVEEVLRRRSRALAGRELEPQALDIFSDVVVVRRTDLTLAVPVGQAREVRRVDVTGFPGSNSHVNGMFQIRGKVLSLVDLASFCSDVQPLEHGDQTLVIVVGTDDRFLGLRIDEIHGSRTILHDEIDQEFRGRELPFVGCVTRDLEHVVDVEALIQAPEVRLDQ